MKDERNEERIFLLFYLEVYCRDTSRFLGSVMDISTNGIRLCSGFPVESKKKLNCQMLLPDLPDMIDEISFKTEVIWCEPAFNPNFYDIGFHFSDLSPKEREIIDRIIEITIYDHCWLADNPCSPMEY